MRLTVPALFFFLAVLPVLTVACRKGESFVNDTQQFESLGAGDPFSVKTVSPEIEKLVVNFFAPDCPPCEKEIPGLKQFYAKYKDSRTVRFVAIGSSLRAVAEKRTTENKPVLSRAEIRTELVAFGKKYALDYPQYVADGYDLTTWRVTGFPETFIFGREHSGWMLKKKIISEISFETLEKELGGAGR